MSLFRRRLMMMQKKGLEFVTMSGKDWFEFINIKDSVDLGYKIKFESSFDGLIVGTSYYLLWNRGSNNTNNQFSLVQIHRTNGELAYRCIYRNATEFNRTAHLGGDEKLNYSMNYMNNNKLAVDETGFELELLSGGRNVATENKIWCFRSSSSTVAGIKGKIYDIKITRGTKIVAHMVPYMYNNQETLLDKINKIVYFKNGTYKRI